MKKYLLLFSHLIKEPSKDEKWKWFVYKATFFAQYFTTFFAIISLLYTIFEFIQKRSTDNHLWIAVMWYFAPLIFYYIMLYIAPAVFVFVIGVLLYKIFK